MGLVMIFKQIFLRNLIGLSISRIPALFEMNSVFRSGDIAKKVIVPECTIFGWENVKELTTFLIFFNFRLE